MKRFRLHWLGGKTEIVTGRDIAEACNRAGIGNGALRALDWYEPLDMGGEDDEHFSGDSTGMMA